MKLSTRKRLLNFLILVAVFSFLGLFFSSEVYFSNIFFGKKVVFKLSLVTYLFRWLPWAFLAPLVIVLSRRFPLRRDKRLPNFFIHLSGSIALAPLHTVLVYSFFYLTAHVSAIAILWKGAYTLQFMPLFKKFFSLHFHYNILTYWIILGAFYGIDYYKRYRERELHTCQLEAELTKARLQALKIQVHPHFLFNTLHTISFLVYRDPKAADRMISRLSELLRYSLEQVDSQETPLKIELEMLDQYVEIMKTRFGDRLGVEYDIQPEALGAFVPNFILQPLVENAIRHGINPRKEGGKVRISAGRVDDRLLIRISDDGLGFKEGEDLLLKKGFGLKNTRERLQKLYGHRILFELKNRGGGGAELTLGIPFHTQMQTASGELPA
jgi:signal transduction histidine kinase